MGDIYAYKSWTAAYPLPHCDATSKKPYAILLQNETTGFKMHRGYGVKEQCNLRQTLDHTW